MAGITAYVRYSAGSRTLSDLLGQTLQASYQLPDLKKEQADLRSAEVTLGGTFPKHFQRSTAVAELRDKTLIFYGELYNAINGRTEAEHVLRAILDKGPDCLTDLNGPFVFFLWDEEKKELMVATDRLGRFPVFYSTGENFLAVTTDLHSLFNAGILLPDINPESIVDFLGIGFPLGDKSFFKGIRRLCGGECWTFSRTGVAKHKYWEHRLSDRLGDVTPMVDAFKYCTERSVRRWETIALTLSGGWDSRATVSIASRLQPPPTTLTFGVRGSTDVELASLVAGSLSVPHKVVEADNLFFKPFHDWAEKVIALSNGHGTIDLAFQIFVYDSLREKFPAVLDSAGCEFHRGIRAQRTAQRAKHTSDITRFLLSMYATGVWEPSIINAEFYSTHRSSLSNRLTSWLDGLHSASFHDQIDSFSTMELWAHHYAHGYPLQTSFVGCQMPFSDNEFYDLFLQAFERIRWSHRFHRAVIHQFAPSLERIPICHGHCRVPYGESILHYYPLVYHKMVSHAASVRPLSWLSSLDNYKPFRTYHRWYVHELNDYVNGMLDRSTLVYDGFLNKTGVLDLLESQKRTQRDMSHRITILLTLAHLLEYVQAFRRQPSPVV